MGHRLWKIIFLLFACLPAFSKDKTSLVATVLYDSEAGPAYLELSDFGINGKRELYVCADQPVIGKEYKHLSKLALAPGMVLKRESVGSLTVSTESKVICALPMNLAVEKNRRYELGELLDLGSTINGTPVGRSANASDKIPANLPVGVEIHLGTSADTELAEYLRASRAHSTAFWKSYLNQYPGGPHDAEARSTYATLLVGEGESHFGAYISSREKGAVSFDELRKARDAVDVAHVALPSFAPGSKLQAAVAAECENVLAAARHEIELYRQAVQDRAAGYAHLGAARKRLQELATVDPSYAGAAAIDTEVTREQEALEAKLASAESLVAKGRCDEAYDAIKPYKSFAGDAPRIAAVIESAFNFRRHHAEQLADQGNWDEAITDFRQALEYRADRETAEKLRIAEEQRQKILDVQAARGAVDHAHELAKAGRYVEACDTLESLQEQPRKLVLPELEALKPQCAEDLKRRAAELLRVHYPIRGQADESGTRKAFEYLRRAGDLTADDRIKSKLELLSDRFLDYYVKEAKRMLAKPRGSGVGLGWALLKEAEHFKPDDSDLRNLLTKYTPQYENRAKLSLSVRFRDQTSRRDSIGFADQITETVASGLESSGIPGLHVVMQEERVDVGDDVARSLPANFEIIGNIIQHHVDTKIEAQSLASRYRSGYRDVKNPEWLEARRGVDALQRQCDQANDDLVIARARKKKNEIASASAVLQEASKKLEDAKKKLQELPETVSQDVILPYNYVRRTLRLKAVVELSFRISDSFTQTLFPVQSVRIEAPATAVVLENVKPEDVDGVVQEGVPVDPLQLLGDTETQAQEVLIKKLIERIAELPPHILEQARSCVTQGDSERAAERYLLYLNSTRNEATGQRAEAQEFLRKQYDISSNIAK